jgi:starch-binding outer membrane protein, SusD/RagB family
MERRCTLQFLKIKIFNMKNYQSILISISLLFLLNTGCKKWLDKKADSSLVLPATLNDLQALLDDTRTMNYNTPGFGGASADEYFLENSTYQYQSQFNQHVYQWQPYPYRYQNDWGYAYGAIYNANLCLERVALIHPGSHDMAQWNNVKGSALFYRAYYFAELCWLFAKAYDEATASTDLAIALRTGSDIAVPSVRASVQASYQQILEDAKEAAVYLPALPRQPTRPSQCAAYGLLARTYLSMRMYDSAGYYAGKALQIKNSLMDYNNPAEADAGSGYPFQRFNSETIFYTTMNYILALSHPLFGNARVDTALYAAYEEHDLRKNIFFTNAGIYQQFKGNYAGDLGLFSGIATDELLLTRAECLARAGDKDAALNDLDTLLSKRYVTGTFTPPVTLTADELVQVVLQERKKELLFRGSIRWTDIKRLNKEGANIILKRFINEEEVVLPPNDKRYALPLPEDVIEQSGMQQN